MVADYQGREHQRRVRRDETSPPKAIPASRRGRRRAAGGVADCSAANLAVLMKADAEKWWPIINELGIKAE
jgi:hypothetical protein